MVDEPSAAASKADDGMEKPPDPHSNRVVQGENALNRNGEATAASRNEQAPSPHPAAPPPEHEMAPGTAPAPPAALKQNAVSAVPAFVPQAAPSEVSSIGSPIGQAHVGDLNGVPALPALDVVAAPHPPPQVPQSVAAPALSAGTTPAVKAVPGSVAKVVKKTKGRFKVLQTDTIMETSDVSTQGSSTAPSVTGQNTIHNQPQTLIEGGPVSPPVGTHPSTNSAPALGRTQTVASKQAASTATVSLPVSTPVPTAPVVKKKGRFVVMPATVPDTPIASNVSKEQIVRQGPEIPPPTAFIPEQASVPQQQQQQAPPPTTQGGAAVPPQPMPTVTLMPQQGAFAQVQSTEQHIPGTLMPQQGAFSQVQSTDQLIPGTLMPQQQSAFPQAQPTEVPVAGTFISQQQAAYPQAQQIEQPIQVQAPQGYLPVTVPMIPAGAPPGQYVLQGFPGTVFQPYQVSAPFPGVHTMVPQQQQQQLHAMHGVAPQLQTLAVQQFQGQQPVTGQQTQAIPQQSEISGLSQVQPQTVVMQEQPLQYVAQQTYQALQPLQEQSVQFVQQQPQKQQAVLPQQQSVPVRTAPPLHPQTAERGVAPIDAGGALAPGQAAAPAATPSALLGSEAVTGAQPTAAEGQRPPQVAKTVKSKPPPTAQRPGHAALLTKGASANSGLGKVFYFLDQMKLEVTDADKTIKSLQRDTRLLRERNKELEARCRNTEARWIDEKNAREAAETKLKSLKKKFKEHTRDGDGHPNQKSEPHSRSNSADGATDFAKKGNGSTSAQSEEIQAAGSVGNDLKPKTLTTKIETSGKVSDVSRAANVSATESEIKKSKLSTSEERNDKGGRNAALSRSSHDTSKSQSSLSKQRSEGVSFLVDDGKLPPQRQNASRSMDDVSSFLNEHDETTGSPRTKHNRKQENISTKAAESATLASSVPFNSNAPAANTKADAVPLPSSAGTQASAIGFLPSNSEATDFDPLRANMAHHHHHRSDSAPMQMGQLGSELVGTGLPTQPLVAQHQVLPNIHGDIMNSGVAPPVTQPSMLGVGQQPQSQLGFAAHIHTHPQQQISHVALQQPQTAMAQQPLYPQPQMIHQPLPTIQHPPPPPPQQPSDPFDELAFRRAPGPGISPQGTPTGTPQQLQRRGT